MWSELHSAKTRLVGVAFAFALMLMAGTAAPSMADEGFSQDLGIIQSCAGDVWKLCSDVLPDVGRMKSCLQNKMGQLPNSCLDKLLDKMAGAQFKVCKDQTYALCAAARCNVVDGVAYCQCDEKHGDSISLPFPMGKDQDVCSINAAGASNNYMVSTYSLPEFDHLSAGRRRGLHMQGRGGRRLRSVRRRNVLQKHRGDDVPGLRQTCAERTNHLFLPDHQVHWRQRPKLPDSRALPMRQVLLQILQRRHRDWQNRFDDLCRCPSRLG